MFTLAILAAALVTACGDGPDQVIVAPATSKPDATVTAALTPTPTATSTLIPYGEEVQLDSGPMHALCSALGKPRYKIVLGAFREQKAGTAGTFIGFCVGEAEEEVVQFLEELNERGRPHQIFDYVNSRSWSSPEEIEQEMRALWNGYLHSLPASEQQLLWESSAVPVAGVLYRTKKPTY